MADWMPGVERVPLDAAPMDGADGARAVWHITWDRNASAAKPMPLVPFSTLRGYFSVAGAGVAPHILWDPFTGSMAQFFPASSRAKALKNAPGGVETNRHGRYCVQIEILFFPYCTVDGRTYATVADTPLVGLDRLMAWLRDLGVPDVWPMGPPTWSGNRNASTWNTRAGHYGHSQVPENDHTDPGPMPDLFNHEENDVTPQDIDAIAAKVLAGVGDRVWNFPLPNPEGGGSKEARWFQTWTDIHTKNIIAAVGGVGEAVAALSALVKSSGLSADDVVAALAAGTLELRIKGVGGAS